MRRALLFASLACLSMNSTTAPLPAVRAQVLEPSATVTLPARGEVTGARRNYFAAIRDFSNWSRRDEAGRVVLTSPLLKAPLQWDELIVSWNAALPAGAALHVEARGVYADEHATKYFSLARWSVDGAAAPRESVPGQRDGDGDVKTDTLVLKRRGARLQMRLSLSGPEGEGAGQYLERLQMVGLSFHDSRAKGAQRASSRSAWGRTVAVPGRFQMDFRSEGGAVWCSPTSVSMILAHWSARMGRPELDRTVPQTARSVHDPKWPGTGNWVFNTAYAGSFPGVRAYVTRLDGVAELEPWIESGVPVALSVDYGLLKGHDKKSGGHLVVCVGFTRTGDVIIADPAWKPQPGQKYRVFPRAQVERGWGDSAHTVYIIHPEEIAAPRDRFGHWDG